MVREAVVVATWFGVRGAVPPPPDENLKMPPQRNLNRYSPSNGTTSEFEQAEQQSAAGSAPVHSLVICGSTGCCTSDPTAHFTVDGRTTARRTRTAIYRVISTWKRRGSVLDTVYSCFVSVPEEAADGVRVSTVHICFA
ncbi:hypothetical protein KM043_015867 [Ampulex compressa]|nr:hypothetical protein KM043_015867 [Ampulex compressa]